MIISPILIQKMSCYKRVNFYELCRLCATNQQKDKTHIFQEEGRKIQLQNKIQSCLSLKVCENDFLPKVVCSQCLRTLEECCLFRKECYRSETMLSSYFNNFRYTDDFKKSGKVYIKDTSTKVTNAAQATTELSSTYNDNTAIATQEQDPLPYYTLETAPPEIKEQKVITQPQIIYNLNTIKPIVPKNKVELNNITVNANGEVITIGGSLIDVDSLAPVLQKSRKTQKRVKEENNVVKRGRIRNSSQKFVDLNVDVCASNNINAVQISDPTVVGLPPAYYSAVKTDVHVDNLSVDLFNNASQACNVLRNGAQFPVQSFTSFPAVANNSVTNVVVATVDSTPKQDVVKRHTCDICSKMFKRRELLYQHMKLHTGFRPFTCDHCNKSFLRKEHLLRHMVSHSGQKNFTCSICDKSFSRNDNLLKHKKIHNKQNAFTCEVCQKQFVMEHYYYAHKRTHVNEKCVNQVWGLLKAI